MTVTGREAAWAAMQAGDREKAAHISNVVEGPAYGKAMKAAAAFDASVSAERDAELSALADSRESANLRGAILAAVAILLAAACAVLLGGVLPNVTPGPK